MRAGLAGALACATLLTAVWLAHHRRDTGPAPPKGPYVALGDSYTSGPKIPAQTGSPAGCARSDHNYPTLVAQGLKLPAAGFRDVSCSGATIADLSGTQTTSDGVNPAQLSALSAATRLVTIGISGNDIGFSAMISQCVKAGMLSNTVDAVVGGFPGAAPCRRRYVSAGTDAVQQKIKTAGDQLSGVLTEIRRRAPRARVYVVGYPAVLPSKGTSCARPMGLAAGDVNFLRQKEQELNGMLRQQAQAAGAGYVDTYTPSVGRDACSPQSTRWIEPLLPRVPALSVHPNERGERGMADAVLDTLMDRDEHR